MGETKGERRERNRRKKRYGHKVRGRSVQTLRGAIVEGAEAEREREREREDRETSPKIQP